jgi:hypothetical protein
MWTQMEILEQFLPKELEDRVEGILLNSHFRWFFNAEDTPNPKNNFATIDTVDSVMTPQFTHGVFSEGKINSPFYEIAKQVLDKVAEELKIDIKEILRIKTNLLLNNTGIGEDSYNRPHVDLVTPHHVVLYYVNDTDGDTIIFDEKYDASELELLNPKRVPPRKGKAICFNGEHYHASCNPIKSKKRVVINYDVVVS